MSRPLRLELEFEEVVRAGFCLARGSVDLAHVLSLVFEAEACSRSSGGFRGRSTESEFARDGYTGRKCEFMLYKTLEI